jgi:hypothetical protein
MVVIQLSSLRELLAGRVGKDDAIELVGDRWGLNVLVADYLN